MNWKPVGELSIVYLGNPVSSSFGPSWAHTHLRMDVIGPGGTTVATVTGAAGETLRWPGVGGVAGTSYRLEQYAADDGTGGGAPPPSTASGGGVAVLLASIAGLYFLVRGR